MNDSRSARRAPRPHGPLSGARTPLRRFVAEATAAVNRALDLLPIGRWLHRRIHRRLELTELELPLRAGAEGLDGLRLAFLSDVHAGSFLRADDLVRLFDRVQALRPDLV